MHFSETSVENETVLTETELNRSNLTRRYRNSVHHRCRRHCPEQGFALITVTCILHLTNHIRRAFVNAGHKKFKMQAIK